MHELSGEDMMPDLPMPDAFGTDGYMPDVAIESDGSLLNTEEFGCLDDKYADVRGNEANEPPEETYQELEVRLDALEAEQ
jgi:hypothetical protein